MTITGPIPENIRRLMPPETRKELNAPTIAEAQAKTDAKLERELQKQIANYLRQRDIWFAWQRMDRKATGTKGQPDFLCVINGYPVALEVKTLRGKLSPDQEHCHAAMRASGWLVYVVRSVAEVKELVEFWKRKLAE